MVEWNKTWDDLPGWHELGTRVECKMKDGSRIIAWVGYDDMTSGPDEWPIVHLETYNDKKMADWDDIELWRYIPVQPWEWR